MSSCGVLDFVTSVEGEDLLETSGSNILSAME